mgnify:FL=1
MVGGQHNAQLNTWIRNIEHSSPKENYFHNEGFLTLLLYYTRF